MDAQVTRPRWIDTKINVQSLVSAAIGAAVMATAGWFALVGRVQALEQTDKEHERHFTNIETSIRQQRDDTTQKLNDIGGDVKDIRRYLMDNAAGARPDFKRWTK
ncbi:hypothetical protein ACKZDW_04320 (plasmid) [Ralstonia syzygii subsp. celebesensis]|uniref:Uncharacterized protein n=2 Tax=Ralstonia syzygii subsp. celebesensis TaxID=1310168 RepID=A0A1U9VQH7_9RALS|nr:hypothetical protein [Ralstonia syzygii]AQW32725.1 hypothetical protein B0B51_23390 [blood disease bacterium A2-HR MARDI]QQV57693.1 hypothetical protein JK151_19790 [Ralstonia syzygii subsp. celebesensis]CCA83791.1 conserved exported hypothetical protein [blood disease bacterium R229]